VHLVTVPAAGERTSCSAFIASTAATTWPCSTRSPTFTLISRTSTVPPKGEAIAMLSPPCGSVAASAGSRLGDRRWPAGGAAGPADGPGGRRPATGSSVMRKVRVLLPSTTVAVVVSGPLAPPRGRRRRRWRGGAFGRRAGAGRRRRVRSGLRLAAGP
jgi:hypothetical protein